MLDKRGEKSQHLFPQFPLCLKMEGACSFESGPHAQVATSLAIQAIYNFS